MCMKMGKVATASVLAIAVACAMPALSDIVLENDAFKLVVGDDAQTFLKMLSLGRRVTSFTTRDAKEIAKLLAMVS